MKRLLIIVFPTIILLMSVGIMVGGSLLKHPLGPDDRLLESVQDLEKKVKNKEWNQARKQIDYALTAWNKIVNRIQFSVERDYMFEINGTLARIKGGIEAKDDQAILEEIYFFYDLFDGLGG